MGSTVSIAQAVGANNKKQASLSVGNTVTLFMGLSVVLSAVLLLFVRPIVTVMSTPEEAVERNGALSDHLFSGDSFYYGL